MGGYFRPSNLTDALTALAGHGGMIPLAGGTDYYPARVAGTRDETVLDLSALPGLRRIEVRPDHWWFPCLATWTDIAEAGLPPVFDGLKQAARQIGGVQIQNAGTLAGNVCNASPAADGMPCLLALDAAAELVSTEGTRMIAMDDFVQGSRKTARRPGELLLGIRIPRTAENARSVFLKLGVRRYMVISIVSIAATIERGADGRVTRARIAVGSCAATAKRLPALEAAIAGTPGGKVAIQDKHLTPLAPIGDIRATAAYRRHAVATLLHRVLAA